MATLQTIQQELHTLLTELGDQVAFKPKQLFVVGCSTSEIIGEHIGTAGTEEVAKVLYDEFGVLLATSSVESRG